MVLYGIINAMLRELQPGTCYRCIIYHMMKTQTLDVGFSCTRSKIAQRTESCWPHIAIETG